MCICLCLLEFCLRRTHSTNFMKLPLSFKASPEFICPYSLNFCTYPCNVTQINVRETKHSLHRPSVKILNLPKLRILPPEKSQYERWVPWLCSFFCLSDHHICSHSRTLAPPTSLLTLPQFTSYHHCQLLGIEYMQM